LAESEDPFEREAAEAGGEIAVERYSSETDYREVLWRQANRLDYEDCPVRENISFEDYCAIVEFHELRRSQSLLERQAEDESCRFFQVSSSLLPLPLDLFQRPKQAPNSVVLHPFSSLQQPMNFVSDIPIAPLS